MVDILQGETLSATASVQTVNTTDGSVRHTLVNDGPGILFYRSLSRPSVTTSTGTEAELRALSYGEVLPGERVLLPATSRPLQYVCGTGITTTVRLMGAELVGAVKRYGTGGTDAKNCASADTNYTLSAQACRAVALQAHPDNTGRLWIGIGTAGVDGKGVCLAAGNWIGYAVSNTNMVNVLAKTAGDDLCYQWVN